MRSGQAGDESAFASVHARAFLQHGLLEIALWQAHFLAEGEQLVRREVVTGVPLGGLQFGGALEDAFECGAIDARRRPAGHAMPAPCPSRRP